MSDDARFLFTVRPRYLEVDQQGVVFNMWYLAYADDAFTAFLAHRGLPYERLRELALDVQLVRSEIDWRAGLRWGEQATIEVSVERVGNTSLTLRYELRGERGAAVDLRIVYVCVGPDGAKRTAPDEVRAALAPPA